MTSYLSEFHDTFCVHFFLQYVRNRGLPSKQGTEECGTVYVRRHLLCPDFATRFVSAFFFCTQQCATARRYGGLKKGGAVYTDSARGQPPARQSEALQLFAQGRPWTAGDFGFPRRMAPPYVRKFNI